MDYAQIRNPTVSLHIQFEDGSNPYVRFNMAPEDFVSELNHWKGRYLLKVNDVKTGIIYLIAKEKGA